MTTEEMQELFSEFTEGFGKACEFLKFGRIKNPAHRRPDICAFIMLDAAVDKPNRNGTYSDMVSGAEHDEIYLDVDTEELAKVATRELIRDLVRCGVRYSRQYGCLAMFA